SSDLTSTAPRPITRRRSSTRSTRSSASSSTKAKARPSARPTRSPSRLKPSSPSGSRPARLATSPAPTPSATSWTPSGSKSWTRRRARRGAAAPPSNPTAMLQPAIERKTYDLVQRPRRLRRTAAIRRMARETYLSVDHLVMPLFVIDGEGRREAIEAMPGQHRFSIDRLVEEARAIYDLGIPAVALFPALADDLKDARGSEGTNPYGLFPRAIRAVKQAVPDVVVISDIARDPYSSDGHDGVVRDGRVANDETLDLLARMALVQAEAGADVIAPSDMMDGRVGAIRPALDEGGFEDTAIL